MSQVTVTLRLPPFLHRKMKALAAAEGISLQAYILWYLESE